MNINKGQQVKLTLALIAGMQAVGEPEWSVDDEGPITLDPVPGDVFSVLATGVESGVATVAVSVDLTPVSPDINLPTGTDMHEFDFFVSDLHAPFYSALTVASA